MYYKFLVVLCFRVRYMAMYDTMLWNGANGEQIVVWLVVVVAIWTAFGWWCLQAVVYLSCTWLAKYIYFYLDHCLFGFASYLS